MMEELRVASPSDGELKTLQNGVPDNLAQYARYYLFSIFMAATVRINLLICPERSSALNKYILYGMRV